MSVILQVEHLFKRYDHFSLEDVCLSLPGGKVIGLVGENGAGKSTLMKCMLGVTSPTSGCIRLTVDGSVSSSLLAIRQRVGYIPEDQLLYDWMSVRRALRFYAAFYPSWDSDSASRLVEQFGLPHDRKVLDLSRGMKAKLLLIAALAHHPPVLLLDEPTVALDPSARDDLLEHLRQLRQNNPTQAILISSHILSDMEGLADEILFLHQGRTRLCVSSGELQGWKTVHVSFPPGVDRDRTQHNAPGVICASPAPDGTVFALVQNFNGNTSALWQSQGASLLHVRPASLQDIYLGVIKGVVR